MPLLNNDHSSLSTARVKCLLDEDKNFGPLFCLLYKFIPSYVLVVDINVSGNDKSINPSINLSINQCIESAVLNIVSS